MKYIVIHGEINKGWELSNDLKLRCDTARDLRKFEKVICTGGIFQESQQGIPVSVAMKSYLGISNVITEDESITSIDNVEKLLPYFKDTDEITVITSWYHIVRMKFIWKYIGKRNVTLIGSPASFTLKRLFLELLGLYSAVLYSLGFTGRELRFRKKCRILTTLISETI